MNFEKDVLESSHEKPVVVDFWAPWCGPCRVLGPVIEQIAEEQKEDWTLVKVNTEEYPDVAMEYGIMSIPNVKMFYHGKQVSEFTGALPRNQILQWLEDHVPSSAKEAWSDMEDQLTSMSREEKLSKLEEFLIENTGHTEAGIALAKLIAFSDSERAKKLIAGIKMGDPNYSVVEDIETLNELAKISQENGSKSGLILAHGALKDEQVSRALELIIEEVQRDKTFHNDLPRRAGIAIFRLLGNDHEATKKYRRIFDMSLY